MKCRVEIAPQVECDVTEAAEGYEGRQPGLGSQFVEELIEALDALADNPLLNCRRHPTKDVRWRHPESFAYA